MVFHRGSRRRLASYGALLRAFSHATLALDTSVMGKHVFGVQNLGTVIGILAAVGGLGSAAGPWVMGVFFDTFGTYTYAFVLFTSLPLIGAWCAWITKPHYWLSQNAKRNAATVEEA